MSNQYNIEKIINLLIVKNYTDIALFLISNLQHLENKNMILLAITNKFLSSEDVKKAIEAASLIITKDHVITFNNRNERSEAFFSIYKKLISKNIYEVAVDISKRELLMCASFSRKEEIKILNFVFCKEELSEWDIHLNLTIIFTELYRLASFDRKSALREPILEIIVHGIKQKDDIYNTLAKLFSNFLDKNILESEDLICIDFLENTAKSNRIDLPLEYDYLCFNWSNFFLDKSNPIEALKYAKKIRAEAFERFKIVKFPTKLYIDLYKKIAEQIPLENEDKISRDDDYTILSEVCENFLRENNILKAREIARYVGVGIQGPFPFAISDIKKRIFDLVESYKITS